MKLECSVHDRPIAPVTSRELLLFVAALALLIATLPLLGGDVLWTRPLWLDELCCTVYPVSNASSPLQVVETIAQARGDYAPPLLHLMVWSVAKLAGGVTPVMLRSISLVCVGLALLLVYAALRRRFDRAPAVAAALAVASHSLVLTHAFEGRFYGPWLFFAAGYAWSLSPPRRRARSRDMTQAAFSIFLVSIHWFGILSLALMGAAAFAAQGRSWRHALRLLAPSLAGLVLLVAFIPFVRAQLATAGGVLWVPPLSGAQVGVFVRLFFLSTVPVLAAVLLLVDAFRDDGRPSMTANVRDALHDPSLAALASLAFMPLLLIVVSAVLQPSMLDRYAIVTVLAWAPFVALGVATLAGPARGVVVVFLAVMAALAVRRTIAERSAFAATVRANSAAFERAKSMELPIVFQSVLAVYPVAGPERSPSALFLDLPDSTIAALVPQPRLHWLRRNLTLERNIARGHARTYGFPGIATQARLDTTPRFLLIASSESLPRLYEQVEKFAAAVFPRHHLRRLTDNLSLLERSRGAER